MKDSRFAWPFHAASRVGGWARGRRVAFVALIGLASAGTAMATDEPLAPTQLVQLQQAGQAPMLLDVRHTDEYRDGHIAGALNIPVEQLAARYAALGVPRDQDIVVYCVSGRRAAHAQEILQAQGYSHVRLLDGSINAWRKQELPLVREGASTP
ncbi:rhodanese-like domain-containing protein [Dyella subtropica]|uniref:rhodanese-like domain-containing protein n=1 Tax=Dyella subtropica TaxID=2992127 RepID=UPI00225C3093|nr:rhodanese-like domain-containing protein [Dyella subtropica]